LKQNNQKPVRKPVTVKRTLITSFSLLLLLLLTSIISLSIGQSNLKISDIFGLLTGQNNSEIANRVFFDIRLPRVILAILVGGGLSIAGVVFQALLKNPLAEPYILGISSGASVGTLIAIMIGFNFWYIGTPVFAFTGSIIIVILVYFLGRRYGALDTNTMLLSGVMIGSFLNAIVLFLITFLGQPVRNALIWLLGNLNNADTRSVLVITPIVIIASILLYTKAAKLNLIATGDELAKQLGVRVNSVRKFTYVLSSIIVGSVVSISGAIGFVGLIIPHACRMIFGPDHRILMPTSFFVGAIFILIMDLLSRVILYPVELPVGALTAVIGAPIFILLLRRK
jgi:iron complex transport system permease protein